MIKFSESEQAFFDTNLPYTDLPDDPVEVDAEKHLPLLEKINQGCHIFSDLTASEPRPSQFHTWGGSGWVDSRTAAEIKAELLKRLTPLTRRQFRLLLVLNGYDLDFIKSKIMEIEDSMTRQIALIEWEDATTFERESETLMMMAGILGMDEDRVNELWLQGLTL